MYLSEQQRTFFQTFGFLAFPGLFAEDIEAITQSFEDIRQGHGGGHGGKAHEGTAFGLGPIHRRMFTINFSQHYPAELLPELREVIAGKARFWVERAYGETMIRTAGPARLPHLEQVMANDGHLAELSRKARETMAEPARG